MFVTSQIMKPCTPRTRTERLRHQDLMLCHQNHAAAIYLLDLLRTDTGKFSYTGPGISQNTVRNTLQGFLRRAERLENILKEQDVLPFRERRDGQELDRALREIYSGHISYATRLRMMGAHDHSILAYDRRFVPGKGWGAYYEAHKFLCAASPGRPETTGQNHTDISAYRRHRPRGPSDAYTTTPSAWIGIILHIIDDMLLCIQKIVSGSVAMPKAQAAPDSDEQPSITPRREQHGRTSDGH